MISIETTGNSHGPDITGVLQGLPAGVPVDENLIRGALKQRRSWYGRGARQSFEEDVFSILQGVERGLTTGEPLIIRVKNRDHRQKLSPLTIPVPGHGDLGAAIRLGGADFSLARERTSARETVVRVALGEVIRGMLARLGVFVAAHVVSVGTVRDPGPYPYSARVVLSMRQGIGLGMLNADEQARAAVDRAAQQNLSLGGMIRLVISGLPPGLGGFETWAMKLDARLSDAIMAIPSVRAVGLGPREGLEGSWNRNLYGAIRGGGVVTGMSGGIEAGMTTGGPVEVFATLKPLSGVRQPVDSWDIKHHQPAPAPYVRSDVTALGPAIQVLEAQAMQVIADAVLRVVRGADMDTVGVAWMEYKKRAANLLGPLGPVVLCGMPGAGKTSVGRELAARLGMDFVDTDQAIETGHGESIVSLVENRGWEWFRQVERETVTGALNKNNRVVALGGGALNHDVIRAVHESGGVIVFLDASVDVLLPRIIAHRERLPMFAWLAKHEARMLLETLLQRRKSLYLQADFRVGVDGLAIDLVVEEVIARVAGWRDFQTS